MSLGKEMPEPSNHGPECALLWCLARHPDQRDSMPRLLTLPAPERSKHSESNAVHVFPKLSLSGRHRGKPSSHSGKMSLTVTSATHIRTLAHVSRQIRRPPPPSSPPPLRRFLLYQPVEVRSFRCSATHAMPFCRARRTEPNRQSYGLKREDGVTRSGI